MAHPNVIHFLAGCAEPPNVYLIMELAKHGTVSGLIHNEWEPLSYALRVRIAKDIACAMEFLHSKNVIHRDLKPDNFLVRVCCVLRVLRVLRVCVCGATSLC